MSASDVLPRSVLTRKAVVYVRQSTPQQMRNNLESQRRQYDLVDVARGHGFAQVEVIDDDLGLSASGAIARPGFQRLVAWLCAGDVGAVLCFEPRLGHRQHRHRARRLRDGRKRIDGHAGRERVSPGQGGRGLAHRGAGLGLRGRHPGRIRRRGIGGRRLDRPGPRRLTVERAAAHHMAPDAYGGVLWQGRNPAARDGGG